MHRQTKLVCTLLVFLLVFLQASCRPFGLTPDPQVKQGESIQIADDVTLKLESWDISRDRLLVRFWVHNTGTEKFLMRGTFSILHQQKGAKDLAPLPFVALPGVAQDCASTLYGYVLPGGTMGGSVCWENISGNGLSYPLKIKYSLHTVDLLKKSVAVWTLATHGIGETPSLNNKVTITVDRATLLQDGDGLKLEYTVENQSPNQYYFDPNLFQIFRQHEMSGDISAGPVGQDGCSTNLLGYIQPGQKASGSICWRGLTQVDVAPPFQVVYGLASPEGEIIWVVNQ